MAKNDDTVVDPVAVWRAGEVQAGDTVDIPHGPGYTTTTTTNITLEMVPDTPEELAGIFCAQCGEKSTAAAKFCFACGNPMHAAPVAGAGFAAEQGARVTRPDLNQFRPKPEAELTSEERAERMRQHSEAVKLGQADPPLRYVPSQSPDSILIHIVEDGFTFAGQVWMRGQELEIGPDHPRWEEVQRWINMDDFAQMDRYGKIRFRKGPWPGRRSYTEGAGSFDPIMIGSGENAVRYAGPKVEELAQADARERQRGRAVPAPTF